MFNKFYLKPIKKRKEVLTQCGLYDQSLDFSLKEEVFNTMIENAITTYELPLGVVPNVVVNGREYVVPMVTEEPSVIAAACNAAQIFKANGGARAFVDNQYVSGQIAFINLKNEYVLDKYIQDNKATLFSIAEKAHPSIVKRGGGLKEIKTRSTQKGERTLFIVTCSIDTKEAMGANITNTIMEALKIHLESIVQNDALMAILSNLSTQSLVRAEIIIDPKSLKHSAVIAQKISDASFFAEMDIQRAATHNKGIMNGIDAVCIASGNDWRAVESSAHAYAAITGTYMPLTHWSLQSNGMLKGIIELPLSVGSVGGTISVNNKAQLGRQIMNNPSARDLMCIMAVIGLAQNFAALYALTTSGIQQGHMKLHLRQLVQQLQCEKDDVDAVVNYLIKNKHYDVESAKKAIADIKLYRK